MADPANSANAQASASIRNICKASSATRPSKSEIADLVFYVPISGKPEIGGARRAE